MQSRIVKLAEKNLTTAFGAWREILYFDGRDQLVALIFGAVNRKSDVPCRIQSQCLSAFVFSSTECDCREQLRLAQKYISEYGFGVILWLDQEGRGQGHLACMLAAELAAKEQIPETAAYERLGFLADARSYAAAAQVLESLGIESVQVLSNNPEKVEALESYEICVSGRTAIIADHRANERLAWHYQDKILHGHLIDTFRSER
jgi:GTP cyclohydrolase II